MTLFELLQEGCTVEFPFGYILQGDPESAYIEAKVKLAGEISSDGFRTLSKEGTRKALKDARDYQKRNKE